MKTSQIYWGAVPFLGIQIAMVVAVIAFPQMVMHYKGKPVDVSNVTLTLPSTPGLGGFDAGLGGGLGGGLGLPPIGGAPGAASGAAPAIPTLPDLSTPPAIPAPSGNN